MDDTLIYRYFDQTLEAHEIEELAEKLCTSPDTADRFACLARQEARLRLHFTDALAALPIAGIAKQLGQPPSQPEPDKVHSKRWKTGSVISGFAVSAALVVVGAIAYVLMQWDTAPADLVMSDRSQVIQKPPTYGLGDTRPRSGVTAEQSATRVRQRLSRFGLPAVNIVNLELPAALTALQSAMEEVDHLGWRKQEPLEFIVENDPDAPRKLVTLIKRNITALDALNLLAVQTRSQLVIEPPLLKLAPVSPSSGLPLSQRSFSFPANWMERSPYIDDNAEDEIKWPSPSEQSDLQQDIASMEEIIHFDGDLIENGLVADLKDPIVDALYSNYTRDTDQEELLPLLRKSVEIARSKLDAKLKEARRRLEEIEALREDLVERTDPGAIHAHLRDWGLNIPTDAALAFNDETSKLIAHLDPQTTESLSTVMNALNGTLGSGNQIFITAKALDLPLQHPQEDRVIDESEFAQLVVEWNNMTGADILSTPSIVTRTQQRAKIEVIREVFFPVNFDQEGKISELGIDRTGIVLEFHPALSGELVHLSGSVDFGEQMKDAAEIPATGSPVKHYITEFDVTFMSGQSAVINCEAPDSQEKNRVIVMTAELVDSKGKKISPALPPAD
ncbi:MAG: hypothetical protein KDN22_23985 [Verrucomicrobiae bacterium]|nr:hypothetical protein [Verrucomicrobiae bacterium]